MVSFNHFSLWVSLSSLFLALFSFLFRTLDGGKNLETSDEVFVDDDGGCDGLQPPEEADGGAAEIIDEKETNEFVFSFRFQTYDEFSKSNKENFDCERLSNRYEILPEKSTSHFLEEAEIPSFTFEVLNSSSNCEILGNGHFPVREFSRKVLESETDDEKITEWSENRTEELSRKEIEQSSSNFREEQVSEKQRDEEENDLVKETDIGSDYDTNVGETRGGFLSDFDVDRYEPDEEINEGSEKSLEETETEKIEQSSSNYREEQVTEKQRNLKQRDEEDNDLVRETYIGSDSDTNVGDVGGEFLIDFEFDFNVGGYEPDDEINEGSGKLPEVEGNGNIEEDSEELNGLETEWEHQELVEQLKMELKKVRATGLPTIFEESESPKIMGELKPWKIDERFQHGDLMEELHKFYRSYRERMRKLDILNYQKMYAMGVLKSKDPLKSFPSNSKSSSPSITSLVRLYRQKKCQVDPMKDFIREVHCDLEMVYVGQMCLSWEFIQWQYEKALALWESEPHGVLHHYNEVAGEFQQFQVLLQRFLENEAFEGPRVENYVKHRCVARNLLQVPVIREDKMKDRRKARWRDHENEASTNDMLVEILQESIRVIWKFIRTDKDQRPKKFQVELQDPVDKQLLIEIQADLQKKERKLKEIVRSGHCILKKLKKNEELGDEETEGCLSFFCEVDMKLVGRVLKMSRITTDQLVWCRNKLNRINFFNRKIHVEPSFFLFPC